MTHLPAKCPVRFIMVTLLVAVGGFSVACQSDQSTASPANTDSGQSSRQSNTSEDEYPTYSPKEGMTKAQIIKMYNGEPDQRSTSSDGSQTWVYHINAGKAFIPFNYGYTPKFDRITFGPNGTVTSYTLSH